MTIKDLGDGWTIETNCRDDDLELCLEGTPIAWARKYGRLFQDRESLICSSSPIDRVEALIACWRERQKESAK
jgi:hypothetical protein